MPKSIHIDRLNLAYAGKSIWKDLSWTIYPNEHYVLGGKSGSGKTSLGKYLAAHHDAVYIANWYQFTNLEGDRNFYYQQRYNRHQGKDTLTVRGELMHYAQKEGLDIRDIQHKLQAFGYEEMLDSQLIELSSGEHKKLQLIKGLWLKPTLLIIDEPYTGLDKQSRKVLNEWLDELVTEGVQLILITNDEQVPNSINSYAHIVEGKLVREETQDALIQDAVRQQKIIPEFLKVIPHTNHEYMFQLKDVHIKYGEKEVLKGIDWEVKVGERWLLQGANGSGKSTLLSLINGDHPQSYGLDITLFGKKRGSGESIWDIKEKIGMISPEMHWYFDQQATVWHTLASGFYDSIGWFIDVKFQEKKQIEELMDFFDLTEYKDQLLHSLPLGKQRLALLARSIIKNPPLLVLDEPCQGLDYNQARYFNDVVDELCQYGKTLIYVGHYESQLPKGIDHKIELAHGQVKAIEHNIENVLK